MVEILHPNLGAIKGIRGEAVNSFLGIKYASLAHRFAEPIIEKGSPDAQLNAVAAGPSAVSLPLGCEVELGLIQQTLPHGDYRSSETECLNLNVQIPEDAPQLLPVFVFFHGGGFAIGSNAWPQYDLRRIVRFSLQEGQPIIGIGVNYRLGAFGFLYSEDLQKAGIKANRGLHDQRVALLWIRENIRGFGGDPDQISIVGESAGGVSCTHHLQSEEPLFNQLMAMGGNSLLMKALPPPAYEAIYAEVLKGLNFEDLHQEERVSALMNAPVEVVLERIHPGTPLLPVLDNDLIRRSVTYSEWSGQRSKLPGRRWCKRVVFGDCQFDASIFLDALKPREIGVAKKFAESTARSLIDMAASESLLEAYDISPSTSDQEAVTSILKFATDIGFYASAICMAQSWPGRAHIYHFNEPNPWDGPHKGESNHILDVAFLFQNFNEKLSEAQKRTAELFGKHFISFVAGAEPFPPYAAKQGGAQVYGPPAGRVGFITGLDTSAYGRRDAVWRLTERVSLDELSAAWDNFLGGR